MKLERAEWGNDLPSVGLQLEAQQHIHTSVEELGSSVTEARLYEVSSIQNPHHWRDGVEQVIGWYAQCSYLSRRRGSGKERL
jgi:hypothetical protein